MNLLNFFFSMRVYKNRIEIYSFSSIFDVMSKLTSIILFQVKLVFYQMFLNSKYFNKFLKKKKKLYINF